MTEDKLKYISTNLLQGLKNVGLTEIEDRGPQYLLKFVGGDVPDYTWKEYISQVSKIISAYPGSVLKSLTSDYGTWNLELAVDKESEKQFSETDECNQCYMIAFKGNDWSDCLDLIRDFIFKHQDQGARVTKMEIECPGDNFYIKIALDKELTKRFSFINIKPEKEGTFKAEATKHNMTVQEFADEVLGHKDKYTPQMVRKAVFAKNAANWKHGRKKE